MPLIQVIKYYTVQLINSIFKTFHFSPIFCLMIKQQKPAGGVAVLPVKEKEPKEKEQKPTKDEGLNGK